MSADTGKIADRLFHRLVEDSDGTGDLSEAARRSEPGNFLRHVGSLAASKLADGLVDPKLVLSWLLTHLGAGAVWIGLLVPVREAGALLPQLFTAGAIGTVQRRKWVWAVGSAVEGMAALGIALVAINMQGPAAGEAILGLLAVLALARSACSVSYKDVLGKTIGKSRRGAATGLASSFAATGVILFAISLLWAGIGRAALVVSAITLAGLCWLAAGAIFATLREQPQPREGAMSAGEALAQIRLLRTDRQLARFVAARSALVGTALAPPYLLMMTTGSAGGTRQLGLMVLASAVASLVSSYVWGRLSDRSSRQVLIWSGIAGAASLSAALILQATGAARMTGAMAVVLFGLMIAYHGVRQGRSTYLVDMAPQDARPSYTAVSNLAVGLVLLAAGAWSAALAALGPGLAIGAFAVAALLGAWLASGLDEVSA